MMADAQKEVYGDGLDPDVLHADMWVNKGHYYIGRACTSITSRTRSACCSA